MSALPGYKVTKAKSARKLLVTLAISAPIAFWMIWLFS
jgi:hypothetical protein